MNFSNNLNTQIQDIRKEIDNNSRESRGEIEAKLNNINKQMYTDPFVKVDNFLSEINN